MKLSTLLFGLLLAVGWTSSVSAQSLTRASRGAKAPLRADANPEMVSITAAEAELLEYTWTDAEGTHTSKATDVATKPEQIYELLRFVYMRPEFPGPSYSAWTSTSLPSLTYDTREDPVYYGGIGGGWDIGASYTAVPNQNLTITLSSGYTLISGIYLIADGDTIKQWTYADNGTAIANTTGWTVTGTVNYELGACYLGGNTKRITIPYSQFSSGNYRSVRVIVTACNERGYTGTITCNGFSNTPDAAASNTAAAVAEAMKDYVWTITGTETLVADGTYTPNEEGYTALVVSVKNDAKKYVEPQSYLGSCSFYTKDEVIEWIGNTIDQVKLLTDGLRIGVTGDYTRGTVFNCDGRYNKFFFLSKGQARKKSTQVKTWISNSTYPSYIGEEVAFKEMFEEFSPTTGGSGDQIDNFYSKMMEGSTYNIVHDCASVIQNGHQFSMSGNDGTTYYALSGLNFFIPDYRLGLWWTQASIGGSNRQYVDGRDFVPYQYYSSSYGWQSYTNGAGYWSAYFAQYNQTYAPKVGIYKITLNAEAEPVAYVYEEGNRNYKVTLTWVSSLNEMSGHNVPQTYTVYYYDENGQRQKLVVEGYTNTDGETGLTTLVYYVEQFEHSYTIDYIVMGTPNDSDHPGFIAWSNVDGVTIPGWDDFLILKLDHHESDYVPADRANWYRNFLHVDNDVYNGLSLTKVTSGMNTFNLYRWDNTDKSEKKVATLAFDNPTATQVHFTVTYDDNGTNADMVDQNILEPNYPYPSDYYKRSVMGIPDEGYVRVRGNGDIVIQPNGYAVNFKSITVKNNGSTISGNSWTSSSSSLPNGWFLSPGSKWEKYDVTGDYYLEGGGYIAIPNILTNSNYTNVTVEIKAYGDGSSVAKVAVNDDNKTVDNNSTSPSTYTWNVSATRGATRAGEVETVTEDFEDQSTFPPFSTGGITDTNHYGVFGDWRLYDSTGETVWGFETIDFTSEGEPHAWFVFNPSVAGDGIGAYSGNQYLEAICPEDETVAADQWLISPLLSGNAQTITFYERILSTGYGVGYESYEVMASTTDNEVSSFTRVQNFNSTATSWTQRSVTLPAGTKYFAIHHYTQNVFGVLIDDITYERPVGGEAPVIEGDNLRLGNLPIVDQLKETVENDNSHPDTYYYILRYEPTSGQAKETGEVQVDIQKAEVEVHGNYTKTAIDDDTDAGLEMDIISADVTMDLRESDPYILYNQMQGMANGEPSLNENWLTQLQQMSSGSFMEMYSGALSEPKFEQTCPADIHHYYASEVVPGTYADNNYFTYAPSVSTWGLDRRYFELDGLDNTYGGPIWKTGVGMVEVLSSIAKKQTKQNGDLNPSNSWTVGDEPYCLYFLGVNAQGYLPKKTVSNIPYEPYMFRVFVESPSGKLRKCTQVAANVDPNIPGQHWADDGAITGKYCVGSFDLESGTWSPTDLNFTKNINEDKPSAGNPGWDSNMYFGGPFSGIDDLKVYVRFYYMTPGWNTRAGDGPDRPGNGSESESFDPQITTGINVMNYTGEVVSRTYVNAQGMKSDKPFDGINIVITRYSDGTTSTTKVVR